MATDVHVFTERTRSLRVALISALSGGATLSGEILGARLLRPAVGSTAVAQAGAVAGILGGLGLGALIGARLLDRGAQPRSVLQRSLAALGGLSLLAPHLVGWIAPHTARLLVASISSSALADLSRAFITVVLTLPFGFLAGAAFPCLTALHGHGAGRATGVTGAASSLGAAIIALATTFLVAPTFGVGSGLVEVAGVFGAAWAIAFTFAPTDLGDAGNEKQQNDGALNVPARRAMLAIAFVGFASSAWQLGFSRLGVLAFGPSAFALAAATAAHTFSLGVGEATVSPRVDRVVHPARLLGVVLLTSAACAMVGTALAGHLPSWSAARFASHAPSMPSLWAGAFGLLLVIMAPTVACIGAAIPLVARVLGDAGLSRSSANARALGAMATGNVLGALGSAMVLIPKFTLMGALLECAFVLAVASAFQGLPEVEWRRRTPVVAAVLVALGTGSWAVLHNWDATSLNRGPFLYASGDDIDLGSIVKISYGREATVAVRRDESGSTLLQIDGKIDATSGGDTATQTLVSIIPALLSAHPRHVLVIGLGSGMTVDAARDVPGVTNVDVTELLPEVIDAARTAFRHANHAVLDSPHVRTFQQDASLFLRGTRDRYDVIVSEPSNPWVAGMADLFTVEALTAAREHLDSGGVMAAWFHAYSTDASTFASILATFREVFPRCALWEMVSGQDYMVIGTTPPLATDVDRIAAAIQTPALAADLHAAGIDSRGALLGRFVAGPDGVSAIARDGELLYASDLRLEFRAPLLLYNDAASDIFALFARAQDLPLAGLAPYGTAYRAAIDESEPLREAALHGRQMAIAREARDYDAAIAEGEQAVAANPHDVTLRGQLARAYLHRASRRYHRRDPGGAQDDLQNVVELQPGPAELFRAHAVLGDMELAHNAFGGAAREYGSALQIARDTDSPAPELHARMAQVLAALGDFVHAEHELDRAIRESTDPARIEQLREMRDTVNHRAPL